MIKKSLLTIFYLLVILSSYQAADSLDNFFNDKTISKSSLTVPIFDCPPDLNIPSCATTQEREMLVNNWKSQFSFSGACNNAIASFNNFIIPDVCTGGSMIVLYKVTDDCGTYSCFRNINVAPATPPVFSCPPDLNIPSCATPAERTMLVDNWKSSFSFSGGCTNAVGSFNNFLVPDVCTGGSMLVLYKVTDDCRTYSCVGNINVAPSTPPVLNCPADLNIPSCSTPAETNMLVTNWQNSFSFSGGCTNAIASFGNFTLPDVCPGGSVQVQYKVTDDCGTYSCSRNINVAPSTPPILNCPADLNIPSCATPAETNMLVMNWQNTFSFSGGCTNAVASFNNFILPDICPGGSVQVVYKVTDDCGTFTCTRNINVTAANPIVLNCPTDLNIPCTTQADAVSQVNAWLLTFGFSGGCNATASFSNFTIPDVCVGGSAVVTFKVEGDCFVQFCNRTINVAPPPVATVSLPVLPNTVSCEMGVSFMAPDATYTNGCNVSGTIAPSIAKNFDQCGGTITVNYNTVDACGRVVSAGPISINVQPAPAATLTVPNFPTTIACEEAINFIESYASYDNGLDFPCKNSGFIQPVVVKSFDKCTGGTITVNYNGQDDCGNPLAAGPIVIMVNSAALPTISLPYVPNNIYCFEANNYYPGDLIYDNGSFGVCENSGMITAHVQPFWDECDGGVIIMSYTGHDDCGNPIFIPPFKTAVLPDTFEPAGICVNIDSTPARINDTPDPDELGFWMDSIASHFYDECGEVVVSVVGDSGFPECQLDGTYQRIYQMEVADECGNVSDTCILTFSGICDPEFCTLSQSFYSDPEASLFGFSSLQILDSLLDFGNNPIVIGEGSCGFVLDDPHCVQSIIGGTNGAFTLPPGFLLNCNAPLNNGLVNMLITLELNVRYNALMNPNGFQDFGNYQLSAACIYVPPSIVEDLPDNPTINDFIHYAHAFAGCECSNTCGDYTENLAKLACVFQGLYSRWYDCYEPLPCLFDFDWEVDNGNNLIAPEYFSLGNEVVFSSEILVYPNPATDEINLWINSLDGQKGKVEIFNSVGQQMSEIFYDEFPARSQTFELHNFAEGVYIISVSFDDGKNLTQKFFVTK